ncbi:hypothetical protein OBBRIDRAFT_805843 [Obba rivulosa]|uniref:Uncharacterized protein n=1 Tax=Obba rivulosa TaxID=1052685 RepID=A0A8E2AN45_9APHY|nr:hypothetical protein OBBRIDRAFT_805843 [Obba rivulosa]
MSYWEPPRLGPLDREERESHVAFHMDVPQAVSIMLGKQVSGPKPSYEAVVPNFARAAALLRIILDVARLRDEFTSVENLERLLEKNEELQEELKNSWAQNDFTRLQSFAFWYAASAPTVTKGRAKGTVLNTEVQTLSTAWEAPYNGVLHKLLCNNIHYAYRHGKARRTLIHEEVVMKHRNSPTWEHTSSNVTDNDKLDEGLRTGVRVALKRLLKDMDQLVPESARREQSGRVKLEVPGNAEEGNLYDALCSSLDVFRGLPIFFVFLSTNSQIALLAPPKSRSKSIAAKQHFGSLVAPFTETPFDCSPKFPLPRDGHTLHDIITVEFMAQLGRPLWGSLLNAMETESEPEPEPESEPPSQGKSTSLQNLNPMAAEMIPLARTKLLSCGALPEFTDETKVKVLSEFYTPLRKRVLAEVRVSLNYEPSRQKTYDELAEMVANHMRMVYSVPQHREYMRSGYSSEPILAEAAAQELSVLNTSQSTVANDLCSVGERGEVVGRTLLTLAYDRAVEKAHLASSSDGPVNYSAGCSLVQFIEELFTEENAEKILDSHPDNARTNVTMREAFKKAHVRFTHFGRLGDDGGMMSEALFAAFLRCQALMGHPTQEKIDALIPIVLDRDAICVEQMTVLMISIKRRLVKGIQAQYDICADKMGIFFDSSLLSLHERPYITLVMELGVCGRAGYTPTGRRHVERPAKGEKGGLAGFGTLPNPVPQGRTTMSPAHAILKALGEREGLRSADQELKHPRYNIYAYGCSNRIYKVISAEERVLYYLLLADQDLFAEHPRKEHLSCIRALLRQKPIWYTTIDSYHWIALNDAIMEAMDFERMDEKRTYAKDAVFAGGFGEIVKHLESDYFSDSGMIEDEKDNDDKKSNRGKGGKGGKKAGGMGDRQTGDSSALRGKEPEEYYENYDIEGQPSDEEEERTFRIGSDGRFRLDKKYDEDEEDVFDEEDKRLGRGNTGAGAEQEDKGKGRDTQHHAVSDAHESEEEHHESEEEILRQKKREMDNLFEVLRIQLRFLEYVPIRWR